MRETKETWRQRKRLLSEWNKLRVKDGICIEGLSNTDN